MITRSQLRLRRLLALVIAVVFVWTFLPYDNALVLLVRWHSNSLSSFFTGSHVVEGPPHSRAAFPVEANDMGIIIKTGFGTQDRLQARLNTFRSPADRGNLVLVADYSTRPGSHPLLAGKPIPVHDVLNSLLHDGFPQSLRLQQYSVLKTAISRGSTSIPSGVNGWELDIMKHIPGLELGYSLMPLKKWYIMTDDDTYLLNASLATLLSHLDSSIPYYIGNAIGDFKCRFAHGGSAVVFSQAAMHRLLVQHSGVVQEARWESLTAPFGDRLIASAAMRAGIYLEERYGLNFNGEAPRKTRIRPDRFHALITTFHKMSPSEMEDAAEIAGNFTQPVTWFDVWKSFTVAHNGELHFPKIREDWDYVGPQDDSVRSVNNVKTADQCLLLCHRHSSACLSWTWQRNVCHLSPWMTVGESAQSYSSGINVDQARKLSGTHLN